MNLLELFAELRRRRVVRTGAAYLVAAWLVIQVAATVFPILELPPWPMKLVLGLLAVGLPITLALAWSFDLTSDGLVRTPEHAASLATSPGARRRLILTASLITVAVVAGSGWIAATSFVSARAAELDAGLIAVPPFRVSGADAGVAYLHEGLVDLIAVKLTGSRRAVDPGTTLAAWRSLAGEGVDPTAGTAKKVAASLGARTVLVGSVVGTAQALTLSATLYDVATGRELATGSVPGSADELPALVDRLVATVLSLEAGENAERLESLTSTSLPAVRAYLDGNAHYRRGRYIEAVESYARALEIDSTFALAALNMYDPAGMESFPIPWQRRARTLVEANRDRLPPRERAYFDARFPVEDDPDVAAWLARLERLTQQFPDRWEAWYAYADGLYHWGELVAPRGNIDRARAGFERALALDSTHSVLIQHLIMAAGRAPDTLTVFRYSDRYLRENPTGAFSYELRLRTAAWRNDTAAVQRMYAALDTLGNEALSGIVSNHQMGPRALTGLTFARRALDLLIQRAGNAAERNSAYWRLVSHEMNAGRPHRAHAVQDSLRRAGHGWWPRDRILHAVFLDGDTATATEAAALLEGRLRALPPGPPTDPQAADLCAVTLLRLSRSQTDGVREAIERLRLPYEAAASPAERPVCAATLDALLAHVQNAPDAGARLLSLDSLMRSGPYATTGTRDRANLIAARLFEARNDTRRAYAAALRRFNNNGAEHYASATFELQCRLAGALRISREAASACERFLILYEHAEPHLKGKVESARSVLAGLSAGTG